MNSWVICLSQYNTFHCINFKLVLFGIHFMFLQSLILIQNHQLGIVSWVFPPFAQYSYDQESIL